MDFTAFKYSKDNIPKEHKKQERFFLELEEAFVEELKSSPITADFFKNYAPDSLDHFVDMYAGRKAHLAKCCDYYFSMKSGRELHFRNEAETVLEAIKQKKLFNLQLKWRAEQITIQEINFSYDFTFWSKNIDACNFLPPVTTQEIEVMKQYLKRENAYKQLNYYSYYEWQNYDHLMKNTENENLQENMPDWYDFYDSHMGTGFLLLLPDIRGKKEEYYINMGREDHHRKFDEERRLNPPPPSEPYLPHLFFDEKVMMEFVKAYETDKYFIRLFEIYQEEHGRNASKEMVSEEIEQAIEMLEEATVRIIMPGGYEWHEAILKCAQDYESDMIIKELDSLYDEYRMFNELGIFKGTSNDELMEEYNKDTIVQMLTGFLLRGREMNGDPRDFNF
jgi:hypothetical protein